MRILGKTPADETRESSDVGATVSSKAEEKIGDILPPKGFVAGLEDPSIEILNVGRFD